MKTFPAIMGSLLILAILLGAWLQAQAPSTQIKTMVMIKGVECEVTYNKDGSESLSLRNLPPCTAASRTNTEGIQEIRCLSTSEALNAYLRGSATDGSLLMTTEK